MKTSLFGGPELASLTRSTLFTELGRLTRKRMCLYDPIGDFIHQQRKTTMIS